MGPEFVIGIDSSTQSTKAIAWSRDGGFIAEGREPVLMSNPTQGRYEQLPDDWWNSMCVAIKELGDKVDLSNAKGLAISNQRETVAFLDSDGKSVRPGIVWLDERAQNLPNKFCELIPAEEIHRVTGKPIDVTPVLYRLYWMRLNEPNLLDRTAKIVDVHGYLAGRLTGTTAASWTSADPFGIFDLERKEWSAPILEQLGIRKDQLPLTVQAGTEIAEVNELAAKETGLKSGLPVIAAGGDGQCAGLGVNAMRKGTAYLNLGTAIIIGAWDDNPRISKSWRTMSSPTGEGYFLEGVLRAGTYFVDWFVKTFVDSNSSPEILKKLTEEAQSIGVGSEGLIVSPYLSGCMNPHWSMDVRAAFFGLRPSHRPAHLFRAILESLTGQVARCIQDMNKEGMELERIICVGGGANSDLWLQMFADSTNLPVHVSNSLEASALGAGITAARAIGWYSDFGEAADAMCNSVHVKDPRGSSQPDWETLLKRQDKLDHLAVAENELSRPL